MRYIVLVCPEKGAPVLVGEFDNQPEADDAADHYSDVTADGECLVIVARVVRAMNVEFRRSIQENEQRRF